jgi:hypothetical protein
VSIVFLSMLFVSRSQVLFACFIGTTANRPCELVTGGVRHVTFWQISGRILVPYNGVFGRKGRVRDLTLPVVDAATACVAGQDR